MAGCPCKGQEAKPALDHQELAKAILLFKASKEDSLIQRDEHGSYINGYDQTDITMYPNEDQRKILINLLQRDFVFGVTNTQTGITIGMSKRCAKKIAHYDSYKQKSIAVYCRELIAISNLVKTIPYTKTRRFDVVEVLLFKSRIRIGAAMFSVQLNVFNSKISGYLLYDINKITQITNTELEVRRNS